MSFSSPVKYEDRFRQCISFEGLERHRDIRPTDIDAFIDYNGRAFMYFEAKVRYTPVGAGQRMALENVVNSHERAGNPAVALIVWHIEPPENEVVLKDCLVAEMYTGGKWYAGGDGALIDFIERFEKFCISKNIKI